MHHNKTELERKKSKIQRNKSFTSQENLFSNPQGGKVKVMNRVKYSKNEAVKKENLNVKVDQVARSFLVGHRHGQVNGSIKN